MTSTDEPEPIYRFYAMPKPSGWTCYLFGTRKGGLVLRPPEGHVPNWFWRKMQFLLFGNRWVKDAPEPDDPC